MDKLWINGNFYTGDKAYPTCQALYVRDGVIMALGETEELLRLAKEHGAEIHDLCGKYVLPGFIDSHMHLLETAQQDSYLHLEGARSFDDVMNLCRQRVEWAKENHKWVYGVCFNQDDWDDPVFPTRKDLDRISTEVPIAIRRVCLHVSVCNTKAMECMGLPESLPEEGQANFDRDADGTLNGIIREYSQWMIDQSFPPLSKEEIKELIVAGCKKAAAQGIVEMHTDDFHSTRPGFRQTVTEAYQELAEAGELPIRITEQCYLADEKWLDEFLAEGHYSGETCGLFRFGPLKVVMDGSLGSHSAYMRHPYKNGSGETGYPYYTEEELYSYMKKAHDAGMQIATHCIGDAALDDVLGIYRRIWWENPRTDCRHGIVHCQIMDDEQLEVFRKMNLLGYVQPIFLRCDMNIVDDCVGEELGAQSYNWRRFLDRGVHLSGGSDSPVESFDVLPNIQYAVTRTNYQSGKCWHPENAVTMEEAIRMFTYEGAYAAFAEQTRGTLTVGKEADMVVLDQDIFHTAPQDIGNIQVLETVVKGNIAFKKE